MTTTAHRRKKILYVITTGNWGGAQRYVYDLATHLPSSEFDVVVASGQPGVLTERLRSMSIQTRFIPSLTRDIGVLRDIRSFLELFRLFSVERPDIIHLNSSKAAFLGALAALFYKLTNLQTSQLKTIFTVHGWPFLEKRNPVARVLIFILSWLTALLSHVVILISEHDLSLARRMPFIGKKAVRIYNGSAPFVLGTGERIRNAFPPGVRITGTVGELTRNKNHQSLIETARKDADMHVAIVGEGELRPKLEALVQTYGLVARVKLFGFIPANEVLRGFDVFALPSFKEGLPYVLLEAKSAGIPIVANRVGGVGEILDNKTPEEFTLETMLQKTLLLYRK